MATTNDPPSSRGILLSWPAGWRGRSATGGARLVAAALLVSIGLIHLTLAPTYYQAAGYIGALFFVTCSVTWLSAAAILVGLRGAWLIGGVTAVGAGAALLLSVTTGLPGFTDSLSAPYATLSLVLEGAFVTLYALAIMVRHSLLLSAGTAGHVAST